MALNKIVYKNRTLMDLTNTTAIETDVFTGKVFYKADGSMAVGKNGGSLGLCLNHFAGEYALPEDSYQIETGSIGFVINKNSSDDQGDDPSSLNLQSKIANYVPTESEQSYVIIADSKYDGLNKVTVNIDKISSTYIGSRINRNNQTNLIVDGATITTSAGYYQNSVSKTVASGTAGTPTATKGTVNNHSVTITPSVTNTTGYITGSTKTGTDITVSASELVSGSKSIVNNGTNIDVTNYATVNVNVPSGGSALSLQSKSVTPSESVQNVIPDTGYDGLSSVEVEAIDSTYVGSDINRRSSTNLTVSGATITAPAGYYSEQASKSVVSGSAGTPTATKGTVSNHSISVTPSVTNTTGYISGGTKTGTAVTVAASELVSGTLTISSSGTKDVTNYASASIAAGTVTAPTSISGTTASVSTGTNTLTLSKTVSVTPSVTTAGYVSSGTAGNATVSLTATISTRSSSDLTVSDATVTAPAGYYGTSASKSVASGTAGTPIATKGTVSNHSVSVTPSVTNTTGYITGSTKTGTAVSVSASELVSGTLNIADNGTSDVTNYASVNVAIPFVTYYTGTTNPSSSLGSNNDIYLKVVT